MSFGFWGSFPGSLVTCDTFLSSLFVIENLITQVSALEVGIKDLNNSCIYADIHQNSMISFSFGK